jgi:hypothetical protein
MEPTVNEVSSNEDGRPEHGLPDYDFETATEAERWAYDQGYEAGFQARAAEEISPITPAQIEALSLADLMRLIRTLVDHVGEEVEALLGEANQP